MGFSQSKSSNPYSISKFTYGLKEGNLDTHYVIVRRDLPLGVLAAMVLHAAAESAGEDYGRCTAVVLEAKNERHLFDILQELKEDKVALVTIFESGGLYDQQLMAIGCYPVDRDAWRLTFEPYQCLKEIVLPDEPTTTDSGLTNKSESSKV